MKIDIDKILLAKNPKLHRFVPHWVIGLLGRLICVDRINYVLENFAHQSPLDFIDSTMNYIGVDYTVHGMENIPQGQRLIFASNHPLGGLDGMILARALAPTVNGQIKLIVNDILMNLAPLSPIFVPINKHGAQSADYARRINELYDSDDGIITFPAGLCSRLIDGKVTDPIWRRNFIAKAISTQRLIVPIYIDSKNSTFFYRLARLRKIFGIKANLEMVLLPREMFDQRGAHINIYIGKPVVPDTTTTPDQIRQQVYKFEKQ